MKVLYLSQQERGSVCAIGLAKEGYPTSQLPGWSSYSFGWHSDDGAKFQHSGRNCGIIEPFQENDTVGMGILFSTREIFVTKNGRFLQKAFTNIPIYDLEHLHPIFGLDRSAVQLNFGELPFVFDLESMETNELMKERNKIVESKIPNEKECILSLVKDYLIYQGFADTFDILCNSTQTQNENQDEDSQFLHLRKRVKECIIQGNSLEVVHSIEKQLPGFFRESFYLIRKLYVLHFINMISIGNVEDALTFITSLNETKFSFIGDNPTDVELLGVIAYAEPKKSTLSHFFDPNYKIRLADEVNDAMRDYWNKKKQYNQILDEIMFDQEASPLPQSPNVYPKISKIELVLKQLMATYQQFNK